ncbi:MAG: tetratricopeptide repeat protein [Endomicrobiales bacterium]|nr:tetratricopeptide repeat protein [Endomicrobiales bacterium]
MKSVNNFIVYLILLVPPLLFFTDLTRNPYYFQIILLNSLTLLFWIIWLYSGIQNKKFTFVKTPLDTPLMVFFAVATVSWILILLNNLDHPYLKFSIYSEGSKRWLFLLVNAILVYYLAVNYINDNNRKKYVLATIWAGLLAAGYGILQYFGIEFIWPKVLNPFGGRSVSTFGNPNFLSAYLVLLFPVIFVYYLQASSSSRLFYFISLIIYFSSLLCTLTRSSWLGLFVAMMLTVIWIFIYERELFSKKIKLLIVPFVVFMLLIVFWPRSRVSGYNPTIFERLVEVKQTQKKYYAAWHQRVLIWSCAWHMIKENPLLGKGWGCFELFFPFYQGRHLFLDAYKHFRTHANNTHNEILEICSQTGIIGLGVYIWFLLIIVYYGLHLIKNTKGDRRLMVIAFLASLFGMWADNLLNVSLHFAVPGFLYWWNMGILISIGKSEENQINLEPKINKLVVYLLIIFTGLLIVRYVRNFMGEINYFAGFKHSKRNDIAASIPYLEKAHRLQRFEVNNNYELANSYARSGMRDKAIWAYKEALRANAGYDEIYFNMATVLMQMGETEEAITEYTRSLYINPKSFEAYSALGSLFLQNQKYTPAGTALFEQCAFFYPENKDIWNNLGYLYTKEGRDKDALGAYKKALEIDPDFELAKRNASIILNRLGQRDDYINKIDELFKNVEKSINEKKWEQAVVSCEKMVEAIPNSFKARFYLANIYFTVKRFDEAVQEYRQALKLQPENPAALTNLGLLYFEMKKYNLSKDIFEKLLKKEPNNKAARQQLEVINKILSASPKKQPYQY